MKTTPDETLPDDLRRSARQAGAELAETLTGRGHYDDSRLDPHELVADTTTAVAGPCPWATSTQDRATVTSEVWDRVRDEVSATLYARWGELRRLKNGTDRVTAKHEGPDGWRHYAGSWPLHCGEALELATLDGSFVAGRYEMRHVEDGPPVPMFHVGLAGGGELAVAIPSTAEVRVPGKRPTPQ